MSRIGKISVLVVLLVGAVGVAILGTSMSQTASAQGGTGGAGGVGKAAHYTVVGTDGTHIIVTDNKTDTLYFYSIEKDAAIGSELKMRGKLDLTQVGKDVLTPVVTFKKEK